MNLRIDETAAVARCPTAIVDIAPLETDKPPATVTMTEHNQPFPKTETGQHPAALPHTYHHSPRSLHPKRKTGRGPEEPRPVVGKGINYAASAFLSRYSASLLCQHSRDRAASCLHSQDLTSRRNALKALKAW